MSSYTASSERMPDRLELEAAREYCHVRPQPLFLWVHEL